MEGIVTFHETARGHLHVMRNIPCEDYSESFSEENGKYYIAIVADGHGATECYRSNVGSRLVCEVTLECLKEFAEVNTKDDTVEERFYTDIFTNMRYQTMAIRQLTDIIIARWSDRVLEYHNSNPLTEEEKELLESKFDENRIDEISQNVLHIYGTTMMAALQLPGCAVLLHQGDGRLNVVFDDGSIEQPVPWDVRCEDTTTTSMCDRDVATSIRTKILNLDDRKVVGYLLGSDGVEDGYRDTYDDLGGTHCLLGGVKAFYKDLLCKMVSMTDEEFKEYLKEFLPIFSANGKFSRSGSGDDVSVAGIVDVENIKPLADQFSMDAKMYSLEEEMFLREDELRGKTRKHGILKKRLSEAERAYAVKNQNLLSIEESLEALREKKKFWEQEAQKSKEELEEFEKKARKEMVYDDISEKVNSWISEMMYLLGMTREEAHDRITSGKNKLEAQYQKAVKEVSSLEQEIRELEEEHQIAANETSMAKCDLETAKKNFKEYDENYQRISSECQRISEEIKTIREN
jgi:FtsZ-binding cell division protein ZapB